MLYLIVYYQVMLLLAFLMLVLYLYVGLKVNNRYLLLFFIVVLSNFGYVGVAAARTFEGALVASRMVYVSGCFVPFLIFLCSAELCKVHIPKWANAIMIFINTIMMILSFTIGYRDLFFKSVTMENFLGTTYLVKEYGPAHDIYIATWAIYMVALLIMIIRSFFRGKTVSYKTVCTLTVVVAMNILVYLIERSLGSRVEFLPISYLVSEVLLMAILQRITLYDIGINIANETEKSEDRAFASFDNALNLVGYSNSLEEIFPEVKNLKYDHVVGHEGACFYEDIVCEINSYIENAGNIEDEFEPKIIERGEKIYKFTIKPIIHGKKMKMYGYLADLQDDTKQQNYIKMIEGFNETLEDEVKKKTARIIKMQEDMIFGFANIVESRDFLTGGHVKRTSGYVAILMENLALRKAFPELRDEVYIHHVCMAAPLHDIGKIAIPDAILNKPGRYEPEEYAVMKQHSRLGGEILCKTLSSIADKQYYEIAWQMATYHHERYDGNGYPEGRKGEEIPVCARVMAVADVFDALTSKRSYKEAYELERAFNIIKEGRGTQFDPVVVDACLESKAEFTRFCVEQLKELEDQVSSGAVTGSLVSV